jgi:hypothetical protein
LGDFPKAFILVLTISDIQLSPATVFSLSGVGAPGWNLFFYSNWICMMLPIILNIMLTWFMGCLMVGTFDVNPKPTVAESGATAKCGQKSLSQRTDDPF